MRILHVCPLPTFSGLEQYALLTATRQLALGHDVAFIVETNSPLAAECAKAGLKTFSVSPPSFFKTAAEYAKIFLSEEAPFDVVHLHSSQDIDRLGLAYGLVRLRNPAWRKPTTVQQNHIWISHSKKDPLHWLSYRVLDEVWCSSEPARESLLRFLPVPARKIQIVRYGRDLSLSQNYVDRASARTRLGLSHDATVIGAIARIDPAKGIDELFTASVELLEAGEAFTLVVIGGATDNLASAHELKVRIDRRMEKLDPALRARLVFTGNIPNAASLMKAFDVYAQASYKETFSLALLDAQLAGLPVIGTSSGGTPDVVIEYTTGWLAEPESASSFRDAMKRALTDRAHWLAYGETARERVIRDFSLEQVTTDILEGYERARLRTPTVGFSGSSR